MPLQTIYKFRNTSFVHPKSDIAGCPFFDWLSWEICLSYHRLY